MPPHDEPRDTPIADLPRLIARYARQEAVEPIRGAGRWLAWGLVGSAVLSIGLVLGVVGVLRLAQTIDALSGRWSWVPYLAALGAAVVAVSGAVSRIRVGSLRREA